MISQSQRPVTQLHEKRGKRREGEWCPVLFAHNTLVVTVSHNTRITPYKEKTISWRSSEIIVVGLETECLLVLSLVTWYTAVDSPAEAA